MGPIDNSIRSPAGSVLGSPEMKEICLGAGVRVSGGRFEFGPIW